MVIKNCNDSSLFFHRLCIVIIWIVGLYSSIIQFYIQIPNAMLYLGMSILIAYLLSKTNKPYELRKEIVIESVYMLVFMAYMLIAGFLFSLDLNSHLTQWMTCLEYLFLLVIISSLIKCTGTNTFCYLLLVEAIILAILFVRNPIYYKGRYAISTDMNSNGLGMSFASGIWSLLYLYQKKKMPIIIASILTGWFLYCVFITGSRKSFIAIALTVGLWFFLCFIPQMKGQEGKKKIYSIFLMIILISALGVFFISQYKDSLVAGRMNDLSYETSEGERSKMYRIGYELLMINPLFGIGFQGYKHIYGSYSHATLVEIPVSGGIIGALIYFSVYFISIKRVLHIYTLTIKRQEYADEQMHIKMTIILWVVMLFYTSCIIHQYQFTSFFLLALIYGDTAYLESRIKTKEPNIVQKTIGSRYIK